MSNRASLKSLAFAASDLSKSSIKIVYPALAQIGELARRLASAEFLGTTISFVIRRNTAESIVEWLSEKTG